MKKKPLYLAGTPKPASWANGMPNSEYTKWLYHNLPGYRDRQLAYRAAKKAGTWKPREGFGEISRHVEAIAQADRVTTRTVYRWLAAGMPLGATKAQRRAWRQPKARPKIQPRPRAEGAEAAKRQPGGRRDARAGA